MRPDAGAGLVKTRLIVVPLLTDPHGRVLLCRMAADRGVFPGQWALPGGGVEPGERIEEALRREVREELGIELAAATPLLFKDAVLEKTYPDGSREPLHMVFLIYRCAPASTTIALGSELSEARWVSPLDLRELELPALTRDTLAAAGLGASAADGATVRPSLSRLSPKSEARESPIQGRGLFAREPIAKGEVVAVKGGAVFEREMLRVLAPSLGPAEIQIGNGLFIGPLTAEDRAGSMIFSNHSCEPNLGVQGQIVFVAMRDVAAGEELTHDWAMTDDDADEMVCRCGAASCRGLVTGQDWRRPELQEKYRGYFSWYLQCKIDAGS